MVSWSRAFKAAILTLLYWIMWGIIGGLIIAGGFFATMGCVQVSQMGIPTIDWGRAFGGIILIIIGYVVIMLGFYASFYKVLTEIIVDEIKTGIPTTQQPVMPPIQPKLPEIELVCPVCGAKNPQQATYCIKCGTKLK
jgi:hypothetical protein